MKVKMYGIFVKKFDISGSSPIQPKKRRVQDQAPRRRKGMARPQCRDGREEAGSGRLGRDIHLFDPDIVGPSSGKHATKGCRNCFAS
jgi:hypothetical protein